MAALLQATLDEKGAADEKLTSVAEAGLNHEAAGGSDDEAEEEEGPVAEKPAPHHRTGREQRTAVSRRGSV